MPDVVQCLAFVLLLMEKPAMIVTLSTRESVKKWHRFDAVHRQNVASLFSQIAFDCWFYDFETSKSLYNASEMMQNGKNLVNVVASKKIARLLQSNFKSLQRDGRLITAISLGKFEPFCHFPARVK